LTTSPDFTTSRGSFTNVCDSADTCTSRPGARRRRRTRRTPPRW
jgi:hypothetical protein